MAYINCAKCPAQALSTGKFVQHLEEFLCISKHKTYIEKEKHGEQRQEPSDNIPN